jgi:hypothetical protein
MDVPLISPIAVLTSPIPVLLPDGIISLPIADIHGANGCIFQKTMLMARHSLAFQ